MLPGRYAPHCANEVVNQAPRWRPIVLLGAVACVLLLSVALAACDSSDKPYLAFAGGGFVFNYRLATADYGFVARVERALPEGGFVEAELEDPAGGDAFVFRQDVRPARRSYTFRTPPVQGVRADRDYRVELRLLDATGNIVARYENHYRSSADQSVLPERPPVVGPGYQRAPPAPEDTPSTQ